MNALLYFADLEADIKSLAMNVVLWGTIAVILLSITSMVAVPRKNLAWLKTPLFVSMASAIIIPTLILFGSTIYLNVKSDSGGPVHWHADIEFWYCGSEIEFRDPTGFLSNKIGTSTYHEHNDKRIHLEGVVVDASYDASLEKYMTVTGGDITPTSIAIPLNDDPEKWEGYESKRDGDPHAPLDVNALRGSGYVVSATTDDDKDITLLELENGDTCPDGNSADVQTYVYTFNKDDDTYTQAKLSDPGAHSIRDEANVPPGDCIIVEFGPSSDTTDKICEQLGVRDSERCEEFGVTKNVESFCKYRQLSPVAEGEDF